MVNITINENPIVNYDVVETRIEAMETVMNGLEWIEDKAGNLIASTSLMVSLMFIIFDNAYQRIDSVTESEIKSLFERFDPALFGALICVYHPETGTLSCVDGYHRYMVAKMMGMKRIPVTIIKCATNDPEKRREYEAKLFISQNNATKKVTPAQKHNGRVLAGDEVATIIADLCNRDDVSILPGAGKKSVKTLGNYAKAYNAARKGRECLEYIFDIIKYSGFNLEPNGYAGYLLEAFNNFYTGYGNTVKAKFIGDYLRGMNIDTFRSRAVAKYPEASSNSGSRAMVMYLQDYATENLSLPAVFDSNGKKVISITEKTA